MAAAATNGLAPKITLYTNHGCPWAHRAHIALKELQLSYEEVIIDLDRPREEWYLKVNPRGLVPAIKYNNEVVNTIVTESGIVAQFLADSFPSHLLPASHESPTAALFRAKVNFFVDTYFSKVNSYLFQIMKAENEEEKRQKSEEMVKAVEKEIEPLLQDAAPFFGGNKRMTMAEVLTAPFILRLYEWSNGEFLPTAVKESLEKLPNFSKWAKAVTAQESVTYMWDAERVTRMTKERMGKLKAAK